MRTDAGNHCQWGHQDALGGGARPSDLSADNVISAAPAHLGPCNKRNNHKAAVPITWAAAWWAQDTWHQVPPSYLVMIKAGSKPGLRARPSQCCCSVHQFPADEIYFGQEFPLCMSVYSIHACIDSSLLVLPSLVHFAYILFLEMRHTIVQSWVALCQPSSCPLLPFAPCQLTHV